MLTHDARLKIPDQVVTRQVSDETVLLNLESGTYFGLDPVGSRFLELLEAEGTLAAVCRPDAGGVRCARNPIGGRPDAARGRDAR